MKDANPSLSSIRLRMPIRSVLVGMEGGRTALELTSFSSLSSLSFLITPTRTSPIASLQRSRCASDGEYKVYTPTVTSIDHAKPGLHTGGRTPASEKKMREGCMHGEGARNDKKEFTTTTPTPARHLPLPDDGRVEKFKGNVCSLANIDCQTNLSILQRG
jgi:hypothetical protein